ncbi:MAG: FAD-dependent oxidoreductase [Anaerolineales bacterium]|nr:FAD-dependent oxidoreductase [Anaerolineales bacterium]
MNSKHDVLIIGGGPIGLSCAYYLLKAGRKVTILDANEIGKGSGSGNAGHIVPSHIIPLAAPGVVTSALKWMLNPAHSPFGLKIRADLKYISWLIQFAAACNEANVARALEPMKNLGQLSADNFAQMIAEEKFDCHYQTTGFLNLYKNQAAFEEGKHEADFMQKYGIPVSVYERNQIADVEPAVRDDVLGGVHFTGDAHLNPAIFLGLLGKHVRAMGAQVYEHTAVTGFASAGGKVRVVKTGTGEFEAQQVILAAGAWSPIVARDLRLKIPVQPARGYSLTASAIQNMPRQALILGDRRVAVSPFGNLLRVTGRLEVGEYSATPNPRWIARLEEFAREYIRLDEKLDIKETWAGLRPVTPDGMPIIGRSPHHSNLTVATGHAMLGLSLGPGTGQVVAELVNGRETAIDLTPFGMERF